MVTFTREASEIFAGPSILPSHTATWGTEVEEALRVVESGYLLMDDHGVLPTNTGAQNLTAINTLIATAATQNKHIRPATQGPYEFDGAPTFVSGTVMVDPTHGECVLKLSDDANDDACLLCGPLATAATPSPARVDDVTIIGFTLDGNQARSATRGDLRPGGVGAAAGHIKDWLFYRTKAHSWKLHGFDIANGGEINSSNERVYSDGNNTHPSSLRSQGVRLIECKSWDNDDDNITVHFADDYLITGCETGVSSGRHPNRNSNGIEIDDGAGRGRVVVNRVRGPSRRGIAVKCHDGYPAPYGVIVGGNEISGCAGGIYLNDPNAGGPSPSAKNVLVTWNHVHSPAFYDTQDGSAIKTDTNLRGIEIGEYVSVNVVGNLVEGDGTFVEESYTQESVNYDRKTESGIEFLSGAIGLCHSNIVTDWAGDNTTDSGVGGVKVTSSATVSLKGNMTVDCGYRGIVDSGGNTEGILTDNMMILKTALAGSVALRITNEPDDTPTTISGNRAIGPWEFEFSLAEDDYVTMRDYTPASDVKPVFHGARETDIDLSAVSPEVIVGGYAQLIDPADRFDTTAGTFTALHDGIHIFQAEMVFRDGDGADDTGDIGFIKNGTDKVYNKQVNSRAQSATGVEDLMSISVPLDLVRGDTVAVYIDGISADNPAVVTEISFHGYQL